MIVRVLLSAFHVLALGLGLGAVFARGRRLRDLRRSPADVPALQRLFQADNLWGGAALLWIATGLFRVFGGLEKTRDFYLRNGFFWVKMILFGLVFALEIRPMVTFIRWRRERASGDAPPGATSLSTLIALNDAEVALVLLIPFVAALMARGAWLY